MNPDYEVIIIGGGPAGLSAALVLARARRKILLLDSGRYRNERSKEMHGYLTRDGILPADFLRLGREELHRYGATCQSGEAITAERAPTHFKVTLKNGETLTSRMLLIATGVRDQVPTIPGIEALYGTSVHHCPYCDGWEWRDKPIAILGNGESGIALTLKLRNWSNDLVLCTHGPARYSVEVRDRLRRSGISLHEERIVRVEGNDGNLERIHFRDGTAIERSAIFFTSGQDQSCNLIEQLGCQLTDKGVVATDITQATNIPGLYVAGDAARDMHFVVVAAAEGAKAGVAMNEAFTIEEASPIMDIT